MQFQNGLRKLARTDPFLIPGTGQQACSDEWRHFRSIIFTASIAHRVLGLPSIEAKTNFLREHLWLEKSFTGNIATRYGQQNKPTARKEYTRRQLEDDPTVEVVQTGLWIKKDFPMLGCSPDGIVKSKTRPDKLLEIKCPIILENSIK